MAQRAFCQPSIPGRGVNGSTGGGTTVAMFDVKKPVSKERWLSFVKLFALRCEQFQDFGEFEGNVTA
jgi:hypothetical protein